MSAASTQQTVAEAAGLATPKKQAKAKIDHLLSPAGVMQSSELHEDDLAVEYTWDPVKTTAVQPSSLPEGADLVLVSVPLDIDVAQLEGAEMVFPSDQSRTGRLGSTVEVTTAGDGADTGVHVMGVHEGTPSAGKVTAVYSLQYSLAEPEAEEDTVDFDALEALRAGIQGPPVAEKKKKKRKRSESANEATMPTPQAGVSVQGEQQQQQIEAHETPVVIVSKKDKGKKRKHAASEIKSHPVHAVGSPEIPSANTPVKKKKKTKHGTDSKL